MENLDCDVCISGGGPAGLMLALLLARAGQSVTVLEKHADFLRDFRGDTIHPSTMEILNDLGLLPKFLELPHTPFKTLTLTFEGETVPMVDFSRLSVAAPFMAMMPQWDFLDFLADQARKYPGFRLLMSTEATGLIEADGRVQGVEAVGPNGPLSIRARLVVVAEGRHSKLRDAAGLVPKSFGSVIDVLWFRLSRLATDSGESLGRVAGGRAFVMLNRGDMWQVAQIVGKGQAQTIRDRGLPDFRRALDEVLGLSPPRGAEIHDWDQVKLLNVQVNRLERWWREGILFIGDAAHAMSPIGGVGISLAIQDAVATANLLIAPLRAGGVILGTDLARVQARRSFPVRLMQTFQVIAQNRMLGPVLAGARRLPLPFRMVRRFPILKRPLSRMVGLGFRMERPGPEFRQVNADQVAAKR